MRSVDSFAGELAGKYFTTPTDVSASAEEILEDIAVEVITAACNAILEEAAKVNDGYAKAFAKADVDAGSQYGRDVRKAVAESVSEKFTEAAAAIRSLKEG